MQRLLSRARPLTALYGSASVLSSAPMGTPVRGFAGGGVPATKQAKPADLGTVVLNELEYERKNVEADKARLEELAQELGGEWKLEAPTGSSLVSLTRKNVRLDLDITPMESEEFEEEEEGEEQDPPKSFRMLASIDGGKGKTMRFLCTITEAEEGGELEIHQAQLCDTDKLPSVLASLANESSPHYLGPDFQTLESALQSAFYDFLASKGVDDAFCGPLLDFCASKEMVEYGNFLEEVAKFSKK